MSKIVLPDGPKETRLAYLFESPGREEVEDSLGLVGPVGRKFWKMCRAEGLPARRKVGSTGAVAGPAVLLAGAGLNPAAAPFTAWVGNAMFEQPKQPIKTQHEIISYAEQWVDRVQASLPVAEVYLIAGGLACYMAHSAGLPGKYRSILQHCSSIIPASEARGLLSFPPDSHLVIMRHPSALLHGDDQWYPSCRLSLNRVARLLEIGTSGPIPKPVAPRMHLYATPKDFDDINEAAHAAGRITIDIETPFGVNDDFYICAFAVNDEVWVLEKEDALFILDWLVADENITIVSQNGVTFDLPNLWRCGMHWPSGRLRDTRWLDAPLRPRMPRGLAHLAAHYLGEGPFNWKHESDGVPPTSEIGRRYCAKDAWYTDRIYLEQMQTYLHRQQQSKLGMKCLSMRDKLMPVIGQCAINGAAVDMQVRNDLRLTMAEAHAELLDEFNAVIQKEWGDKIVAAAVSDLPRHEKEWTMWRDAAFSKKGIDIRKREKVTVDEAKKLRENCKKFVGKLRDVIDKYSAIRPTQDDIIRDFLFHSLMGLRIKATGRKTPTGKLKIGRKELSSLLRRADVQERIAKGEKQLLILRTISDAERLRATLENHLGAELDEGRITLSYDRQVHDGRLSVIYNPVQMRFSAGKGDKEKADPFAFQVHNMPYETVATVKGIVKTWQIRRQIVADKPAEQRMLAADWSKIEQYIMAWRAGSKLQEWDWLKALYDGVDTHCETASIAYADYPMCNGEKGCIHRRTHIDAGGIPRELRWVGKQVNHAATLGATAKMLNEQYDIPLPEGRMIMRKFADSPRGQTVSRLHASIEQEALENTWVMNPFTEGVDFYGVEYKRGKVRLIQPNRAYATAQQGPAALIMQHCMPDVDEALRVYGGRVILSTHDEFLGCFDRHHEKGATVDVRSIMEREWPEMPVPFDKGRGLRLKVDIGTGDSWHEAKG